MSKPRGKAIQRELTKLAKEILQPFGYDCFLDFSKRGGHQQLKVTHPLVPGEVSLEIVSTPRDEGQARQHLRQKCNRLIRSHGLA